LKFQFIAIADFGSFSLQRNNMKDEHPLAALIRKADGSDDTRMFPWFPPFRTLPKLFGGIIVGLLIMAGGVLGIAVLGFILVGIGGLLLFGARQIF
jgi:hypothetical protein